MIHFTNNVQQHEKGFNAIKEFFVLKRHEEKLGIATIKFKDIPFNINPVSEFKSIREFFKHGIYEPIDYRAALNPKNKNTDMASVSHKITDFKYYCKSVWLAEGFLEQNELDHPLNVFWCPRTSIGTDPNEYLRLEQHLLSEIIPDVNDGVWKIGNGYGRAKFLSYFLKPNDDIKVLAFTTFGKELDFDIILKNESKLIEYYGEGMILNLSLNWGTAIPFVNASIARKVPETCTEYHKKIYDWFKSTEITSNVKLSTYNLQPPNTYHRRKIKGNVHFELTSDLLEKNSEGNYSKEFYFNMNKICILLPLMNNERSTYQDDKFTIKYTPY